MLSEFRLRTLTAMLCFDRFLTVLVQNRHLTVALKVFILDVTFGIGVILPYSYCIIASSFIKLATSPRLSQREHFQCKQLLLVELCGWCHSSRHSKSSHWVKSSGCLHCLCKNLLVVLSTNYHVQQSTQHLKSGFPRSNLTNQIN